MWNWRHQHYMELWKSNLLVPKLMGSHIATQKIQDDVHTVEKCPTVVTETDVTISEPLHKIVPIEYRMYRICVWNYTWEKLNKNSIIYIKSHTTKVVKI